MECEVKAELANMDFDSENIKQESADFDNSENGGKPTRRTRKKNATTHLIDGDSQSEPETERADDPEFNPKARFPAIPPASTAKKCTNEQREVMLAFMKEHPTLGHGKCPRIYGAQQKKALLEALAQKLNAFYPNGPIKTPDKWFKSWQDWRSDTRAKAQTLKKQSSGSTCNRNMTPLEEDMLNFVNSPVAQESSEVVDSFLLDPELEESDIDDASFQLCSSTTQQNTAEESPSINQPGDQPTIYFITSELPAPSSSNNKRRLSDDKLPNDDTDSRKRSRPMRETLETIRDERASLQSFLEKQMEIQEKQLEIQAKQLAVLESGMESFKTGMTSMCEAMKAMKDYFTNF